MATHSNTLVWRILWIEEHGRLQSMESQRVDTTERLHFHFHISSFVFDAVHDPLFGEGNGNPTPVLLPGKSHGPRGLVGCSPWGHTESDTTEGFHFHFSLSCIGEGNGNPLQCSCLENIRDGGAWWAAISGVAQSRTQLKRLSSSSSSISSMIHY